MGLCLWPFLFSLGCFTLSTPFHGHVSLQQSCKVPCGDCPGGLRRLACLDTFIPLTPTFLPMVICSPSIILESHHCPHFHSAWQKECQAMFQVCDTDSQWLVSSEAWQSPAHLCFRIDHSIRVLCPPAGKGCLVALVCCLLPQLFLWLATVCFLHSSRVSCGQSQSSMNKPTPWGLLCSPSARDFPHPSLGGFLCDTTASGHSLSIRMLSAPFYTQTYRSGVCSLPSWMREV